MRLGRAAIWGLLCLGLAVFGAGGCAADRPVRQIALTFDDAPLPDGHFLTGEERARRIIGALREAEVREVAFFANPGRPLGVRPAYPFDRTEGHQFTADVEARLRAYAEAGHVLANHTATHPNLRDVTAEAYMADVAAADLSLRPLPGFRPWFRFPYLSEGETLAKRDAVRRGLVALGYRQGYVTADSYDWRLDQLAAEAGAAGQEMNMEALRDLYVRSALEGADYYDRMAVSILGRSPKQVLLLHENDLAALFLEDLIEALRRDGWTVIGASEAYSDPIAAALPDTLALGEGRIAALVHAANAGHRFPEQRARYNALDQPFAEQVAGARSRWAGAGWR